MGRSRRRTLRTVACLAGGLALAGCTEQSTREEGSENEASTPEPTGTPSPDDPTDGSADAAGPPAVTDYLGGANGHGEVVVDATGQDVATVEVGAGSEGLTFFPPAIHVDAGTTVEWEWTGKGGAHNVVAEDGSFDAGAPVGSEDADYEHTFERDGIYRYYCHPHEANGEKGAVVVGTNYPTSDDPHVRFGTARDAYLHHTNNYDGSITDLTGQSSVTVEVGGGDDGLVFSPPAVRIDAGTTVEWEWTGEGGAHSVVAVDGRFESDITAADDATYRHTFEESGRVRYYCLPHALTGMKGVVEVVA
jgi:halocyanin-like protein